MPSLLLKVRRARWYRTDIPAYIDDGDVRGDCLTDLKTNDNKLSVWYVDDDRSNLDRVLTALAANCDDVSNIDYLLFDYEIVTELGLIIRKTEGGTPDKVANASWHHDLIELSGRKIVNLAVAVFQGSTPYRQSEKTVGNWLRAAAAGNSLDISRLKPKLAAVVLAGASEARLSRLRRMLREVRAGAGSAWQRYRDG